MRKHENHNLSRSVCHRQRSVDTCKFNIWFTVLRNWNHVVYPLVFFFVDFLTKLLGAGVCTAVKGTQYYKVHLIQLKFTHDHFKFIEIGYCYRGYPLCFFPNSWPYDKWRHLCVYAILCLFVKYIYSFLFLSLFIYILLKLLF